MIFVHWGWFCINGRRVMHRLCNWGCQISRKIPRCLRRLLLGLFSSGIGLKVYCCRLFSESRCPTLHWTVLLNFFFLSLRGLQQPKGFQFDRLCSSSRDIWLRHWWVRWVLWEVYTHTNRAIFHRNDRHWYHPNVRTFWSVPSTWNRWG